MSVTISSSETKVYVKAPYHPEFSPKAKKLGGKWDAASKSWSFDLRDLERVKALCREVYGTDGSPAAGGGVTVRLTALCDVVGWAGGIYFAGRCLCTAFGRDTGAKLSEGVICLSEQAPRSGGSVKNWKTIVPEGTILEVRDLPRLALENAQRALAEVNAVWDAAVAEHGDGACWKAARPSWEVAPLEDEEPAPPAISPQAQQALELLRELSPEERQAVLAQL